MIKNRDAQLIFESFYCAIGLIGVIASLGLFQHEFRSDFYVHFTNLSNYVCLGIMFAGLVQTTGKKTDSYVSALPILKFMGVLMILLTFLVFNILLAPAREPALNFTVNSITFHVILPIMYTIDWVLFYERGRVKWYYPLLSLLVPFVYVAFVYMRAWILNFNTDVPYLYPYFFLNLETQGVAGVIKWIIILMIFFLIMGYFFFAMDRLIKSPKERT